MLFGNNSYLTELDPTQPNPWVNPTHGHVWVRLWRKIIFLSDAMRLSLSVAGCRFFSPLSLLGAYIGYVMIEDIASTRVDLLPSRVVSLYVTGDGRVKPDPHGLYIHRVSEKKLCQSYFLNNSVHETLADFNNFWHTTS